MFPLLLPWLSLAAAGCDCGDYRAHHPPDENECEPGQRESCHGGPAGTEDVGACRAGTRSCADGRWTDCLGEVLPSDEVCNGEDDDCDGAVDEDVLSECGDCDPGCERIRFGHEEGDTPFEAEPECLAVSDDGALVLSEDVGCPSTVLWVPNTAEGTISLVDTWWRREIARYRTGPSPDTDRPSRTAQDSWSILVANQAPGGQASVTRILYGPCEDRDEDGAVETSTGRDDVLAWGEDECVDWSTEVGGPGAQAYAIAVREDIVDGEIETAAWVGLRDEGRYVELDPETGEPTGREVDCAPCEPHGAAIDGATLWSACGGQNLVCRVDTDAAVAELVDAPTNTRGIAVDSEGRVWTGSRGIARYVRGEWAVADGIGRSETIMADFVRDQVWVGDCELDGGRGICMVDAATLDVTLYEARSKGVVQLPTVEVWGLPESGEIDAVDLRSGEVVTLFDDCDGGPCFGGPDAYSDLLGPIPNCSPEARCDWTVVIEGCPAGETRWLRALWEVDTPGEARLALSVRAGASRADLDAREWTRLSGPPADLAEALGGDATAPLLEVRATLVAPRVDEMPVVHAVEIQRSCR